MGVVGPTLLTLSANTHSTLPALSYIFIAASTGYFGGALLVGRLYDRYPGHPILAIGTLIAIIGLVTAPLTSSLPILVGLFVLFGLAEALLDAGGNTLLVWTQPQNIRPLLNGLHFTFGLGTFFAPMVVAQVIQWQLDVRWAYWLIAAFAGLILIMLLLLPSPPIRHTPTNSSVTNGISLPIWFWLFCFLYVGAEVGVGRWIATYTEKIGIGDAVQAAYMVSIFAICFSLGRLAAVFVSRHLSSKKLIWGSLIGSLLMLVLFGVVPASLWSVRLTMAGFGLCMAPIYPTMLLLTEERIQITGRIMGAFGAAASLGAMVHPWAIGQLFEQVGPTILESILLATMFAALLVIGWILRLPPSPKTP